MIVVTTPTGLIGHQVLNNLSACSEPLRVIVRDPSRLPAHTHERVEVVQGSHGDLDVVNQAFAGAHSVFWLVPPDPRAKTRVRRLRGLQPTGSQSHRPSRSRARREHLGSGTRSAALRRQCLGVAGYGRPDHQYRSAFPCPDDALVHGQRPPPSRLY